MVPASPARKDGVKGSYNKIAISLPGREALPSGRTPARKGGEASKRRGHVSTRAHL